MRVVAVDVGAVGSGKRPSRFAWAAVDAPRPIPVAEGNDPEMAVDAVLAGLRSGRRVALLLEAPVSIPVPAVRSDQWSQLGKARQGEGNRAWSAGAGAGVLATGLAQGAWMLARLAAEMPEIAVTTQPTTWASDMPLLLAEALVSGAGKPVLLPTDQSQHSADAAAAALAMLDRLEGGNGLVSDVHCAPQQSFNLWAAMALWARLQIDPHELHQEVAVIRLDPQPRDPG